MPTSKTFLPDVNVWLALASPRHIHTPSATRWLETVQDESLAFCRITQMGLLRLLTNSKVMGVDLLSQSSAWEAYDRIREDLRVSFAEEPPGLEEAWRFLTFSDQPANHRWTDAYLLAFAKQRRLTLVTFDQTLANTTGERSPEGWRPLKTEEDPAVVVLTA